MRALKSNRIGVTIAPAAAVRRRLRGAADAWQKRSELALAMVGLAFLGAISWPILDPALPTDGREACHVTIIVSWAVFAGDYLFRLVAADRKRTFVLRNLLDLASLVLPMLRPLRLLRLVTLVRILNRQAVSSLHGRVAAYAAGAALLSVYLGALGVLDVERHAANANIKSFGDALWWAATTVTTETYGDKYPVTATGRFVAEGLMVVGISIVGVVTAALATWFVEKVRVQQAEAVAEVSDDISGLQKEVRELRELLQTLVPQDGQGFQVNTPP